ncbi:hypothetical protein BD410DRAFT_850962 [Rickenella mellea]|uniref:Protein kinase domain-containing protein n=1 Tax=Rickenella mellea TaxID=50990 RepID=A0A4Y7QBB2_9AGAM|nr:hypothetical protein BD410DRAFT_850962 [Rickenella mellea]
MSSLVVKCDLDFLQVGDKLFRMDIGMPTTSNPDQPPLSFTEGKKIYGGDRIQVYLGKLLQEGKESVDVVMKVDFCNARHGDLVQEAKYYETQAKALQGKTVPLFYGIYSATIEHQLITGLVLEYCGEPMETSLEEASEIFSFEVAKLLMALHSASLQHNDITEGNIVVKDGVPRLIDLGTATLHDCKRTKPIKLDEERPSMLEFGCRELHNFASQQGIWEPTMTPHDLIETEDGRKRIESEAREILKYLGIGETLSQGKSEKVL